MNVPLIGQQKQQPMIDVDVRAENGHVVLRQTYFGVLHHDAPMNPQIAANVMAQIGMKLEELQPGTLIQSLKNWIEELESMKSQGKKVLQELGL